MPVSIIPFNMPAPAEIPPHIVEALQSMPPDDAVKKAMELLMQIEAAETLVYERVNAEGVVQLQCVVGRRAAELEAILGASSGSFAAATLAQDSAVLIMGQASVGEENALPEGMVAFLLDGAESGSTGFNYVLPLRAESGSGLGALTLLRGAGDGPLNHEQPNICEAMRRQLSALLDV